MRALLEHVLRDRAQIGQKAAFGAERKQVRLSTDEPGRSAVDRIVDVGNERDGRVRRRRPSSRARCLPWRR